MFFFFFLFILLDISLKGDIYIMYSSKDFLIKFKDIIDRYKDVCPDNYDNFIDKVNSSGNINFDCINDLELFGRFMTLNSDVFIYVLDSLNLSDNYCADWFYLNMLIIENKDLYNNVEQLSNYQDALNKILEKGMNITILTRIMEEEDKELDDLINISNMTSNDINEVFNMKYKSNDSKTQKNVEQNIIDEVNNDFVEEEKEDSDFNIDSMDLGISLIQNNSNNEVLKALDQMSHMILVIRDKTTSAFTELSNSKNTISTLNEELLQTKNKLHDREKENASLTKELEVLRKNQESINNLLNSKE